MIGSHTRVSGGGGGGDRFTHEGKWRWWWWLFPRMRRFGRRGGRGGGGGGEINESFPNCLSLFFYFYTPVSGDHLAHTNPLFRPGISPQWLNELRRSQRNVCWQVACQLVSPIVHYAWDSIVSPLRLRWVKGVCVFVCNLLPALLAE